MHVCPLVLIPKYLYVAGQSGSSCPAVKGAIRRKKLSCFSPDVQTCRDPVLFFFCREHRTSAAFRPGLATGAAEASPWSASRTLSEERACGSTSTLGLARRSAQGVARQIMMAFSVAFQGCTWQGRYSGGHPGNMPGQIPEYSRSNEVQYQVTSEYIFYKIHPWRL